MEKHFKICKYFRMNYKGRLLYRIEATKDLLEHGVKKGDIGGWIEKEENLQDDAWIADNAAVFEDAVVFSRAKVCDNAEVYGNAKVYCDAKIYGDATVIDNATVCDNAEVYGNTIVYDNAIVYGNAKVYCNAQVSGNALICDNAQIYGKAKVYGDTLISKDAKVCDNAEVYGNAAVSGGIIRHRNDWKNIAGERYNITIIPKYIKIGCQQHTKEKWWKFTDREILAMSGKEGLKWWQQWKPILMSICEAQTNNKEG